MLTIFGLVAKEFYLRSELFIDCDDKKHIWTDKVVYIIYAKTLTFLTQKGRYLEKYFWSKLSSFCCNL